MADTATNLLSVVNEDAIIDESSLRDECGLSTSSKWRVNCLPRGWESSWLSRHKVTTTPTGLLDLLNSFLLLTTSKKMLSASKKYSWHQIMLDEKKLLIVLSTSKLMHQKNHFSLVNIVPCTLHADAVRRSIGRVNSFHDSSSKNNAGIDFKSVVVAWWGEKQW